MAADHDARKPQDLVGSLPDAARHRVLEFAARRLGTLPPDEIPPPLRRVARFEPRRRARLAATQLATQLEDQGFREQVAEEVRSSRPDLADAVARNAPLAAVVPAELAAAAYLLRPPGWTEIVRAAAAQIQRAEAAADDEAAARTVARLRQQLAAAKAAHRNETERLRVALREARAEASELRRKLHDARERAARAELRAREATRMAEEQRAAAEAAASAEEAEGRRLRRRLADAEAELEAVRRSAREARTVDDSRLRVLLDTLIDAAQGLGRELALPSTISRPADAVGAIRPEQPSPRSMSGRALADDDPELFDRLLRLPRVHVIVDGYNVTKSGYPQATLQDQRARLLTGLGGLASRTRVEVTCVFDGADLGLPASVPAPRGVRVLFSEPGETADHLICRLVTAEPPGRAMVVVSSDREIADAVRRAGARPVPASLLLRRLERT